LRPGRTEQSLRFRVEFAHPFIECSEITPQSVSVVDGTAHSSHSRHLPANTVTPGANAHLLRRNQPYSATRPRIWFAFAVRCLVNPARMRCTAWISCWSTLLHRHEPHPGPAHRFAHPGRLIASQIASASLASFLLLFTIRLYKLRRNQLTLNPVPAVCAPSGSPTQDSMPISQPGSTSRAIP